MLILYITYIDFEPTQSGSATRPQKMYRAFLEEGHQVKLLEGEQGNFQTRERRAARVREISRWLDDHTPDLCYIESPVYPILWEFDRRLIRRICAMGIPTAYFTRDAYDRFPELFPPRTDPMGRIKDAWLKLQRRLTEKTLQHVDICYFPVAELGQFYSYADKRALPPAGENHLEDARPEPFRSVYVGGMVNHYGGELLLRAYHLLNQGERAYPLTLICREKEWAQIPEELKNAPWLELHHTSGEALIPLLGKASLGLIIVNNAYGDYALPIKLFEYMGYGLPVVFFHNAQLDSFVERVPMGCGADTTPEAMAEAIRDLLGDEERLLSYRRAASEALLAENLWIHRVRQIIRELEEKKEARSCTS